MIETLNALSDEQLRAAAVRIETLLKERDTERKELALQQARTILAQAGLQLQDVAKARHSRPPLKSGTRYVNPNDPTQFYIAGNGRPPGWFEKLRAKGKLPEPIASPPPHEERKEAGVIKRTI